MSLCLANNLIWGGNFQSSPTNIEKLIGWWDFNDTSTIFTGAIDSLEPANPFLVAKRPIKKVINKANSGNKNLGRFLRTYGDSVSTANMYVPQTVNGLVRFACSRSDASNTSPLVSSRVDGFGGITNGNALGTSGLFSDATINNHNLTIIIVIDSLITNVTGDKDSLIGIGARVGGFGQGTPYAPAWRLCTSVTGDDWQWSSPNLDGSALLTKTDLDTDIQLTTSLEAWTIQNGSGSNGVKMYRNFDTSDGASTTITNTGADVGVDFDMEDGFYSLGAFSTDKFFTGIYEDANHNINIFEVLIYNKNLTNEEMNIVESYIKYKYAM
mgnify:FL=1